MNLRNDLTEEELKMYMLSISATISKLGKSNFEIEVPHPNISDRIGLLMFNQEVRKKMKIILYEDFKEEVLRMSDNSSYKSDVPYILGRLVKRLKECGKIKEVNLDE